MNFKTVAKIIFFIYPTLRCIGGLLVDLYFRRPTDSELGEFMSVARALQMISNGISQKLSAVNVGRAFSDLGFKRVRTNSSRGFIVVCRTPEEIKAYQHRLLMDAKPDSEVDAPF